MKKFLALLVVFTLTFSPASAIAATPSRSPSPSFRSSPSRSSTPPSRPAPRATPRPTAQASKSKPKVAWTSTKKYGQTKSQKTGKRPLFSRTPKPEPHTYNGRTYKSSDAIYTNTSGKWVTYFILGAIVGGVLVEGAGDDPHCFDENHVEIKCDRDDNSWMKDW